MSVPLVYFPTDSDSEGETVAVVSVKAAQLRARRARCSPGKKFKENLKKRGYARYDRLLNDDGSISIDAPPPGFSMVESSDDATRVFSAQAEAVTFYGRSWVECTVALKGSYGRTTRWYFVDIDGKTIVQPLGTIAVKRS